MNKEKEVVEKDSPTLLILGIACVIIAVSTTAISLFLYKSSGDIYLDRSRPGFLPDEDDDVPAKIDYKFQDSGALTAEVLSDYLENLDNAIDALDALEDPFSPNSLSDESLGISGDLTNTDSVNQ